MQTLSEVKNWSNTCSLYHLTSDFYSFFNYYEIFRFLTNPTKDVDLRRWAAEGLAFLTLDADVKEDLINDKEALQSLIDLPKV